MKVSLFHPMYVIENTLCSNDLKQASFDDTNWKLHNTGKLFFNLYEFLDQIGRLDILEKHFDRMEPTLEVRNINFMVMNGKRPSSYYSRGGITKLDEELDILMTDPSNKSLWDSIKDRRIDWRKQKIYKFHKVETFECTPS